MATTAPRPAANDAVEDLDIGLLSFLMRLCLKVFMVEVIACGGRAGVGQIIMIRFAVAAWTRQKELRHSLAV